MVATLLLALAASASQPNSGLAARATATIVEGRRIHLGEQFVEPAAKPIPQVQRTRVRRSSDGAAPSEWRLLEFQ
jgi:hypothetical protein